MKLTNKQKAELFDVIWENALQYEYSYMLYVGEIRCLVSETMKKWKGTQK